MWSYPIKPPCQPAKNLCHRIVVEPACGAALATVYEHMAEIEPFQSIVVIVCGGATASVEQLNQWSKL
jgi:L-serine/L-threonine ammonia-lyase